METIIGFAAGYFVGAQDGRPGLNRLRTSVQAIANSPEARKLAAQAVTIAGAVIRRSSTQGLTGTARGVAGLLIRRVSATADAQR